MKVTSAAPEGAPPGRFVLPAASPTFTRSSNVPDGSVLYAIAICHDAPVPPAVW